MTNIFARNFDIEFEEAAAATDLGGDSKSEATMTIVEAEMMAEKAKAVGYEEGMIAGGAKALSEERASRKARSDEALIVLSNNFMDLSEREQRLRAEVELEMAEVVAGIGERLLPDLFEDHVADLLVARINSAIKFASGEGQVTVKVPPELEEELTPRLEALVRSTDRDVPHFRILADSQIDDGTIRMTWKNGSMEFDPAFASAEALNALKEAIFELKMHMESLP